jgi:DNA polymerase
MLHIDIETYSDIDITTSGAYRYIEDDSFEIMLIAYAFGDKPVRIIDLANGDIMPYEIFTALKDPAVIKVAHNAQFERLALRKEFGATNENWFCNAVYSGYCGYPMSLEESGKALKLGTGKAKMKEGKELIKLFCRPQKPAKKNNFKTRIYAHDEPEKWEIFKSYCVRDVEA